MKHLNTRQALILIILNGIAIMMAAILLIVALADNPEADSGNVSASEWNLNRAPRASLNENIKWETNLGGSGNETVVGSYYANNKIYIFGNTDSTDLDFNSASSKSGYLAVIENGSVISLNLFAPLVTVTLHEKGYLAASDTSLILIDYTGAVISETAVESPFELKIVDLKMTDGGYIAITESTSVTELVQLKIFQYDFDLKLQTATECKRSSSLIYLDAFINSDSVIIAANVKSDLISCLTLIEILPTPVYHDVPADFGYFTHSVIPCGSGYTAIIADGAGTGNILRIGADYSRKSLHYLNVQKTSAAQLIYSNMLYYAYFHITEDISTLAVLDQNLNYLGLISSASSFYNLYSYYSAGQFTTFFAQSARGLNIISVHMTSVHSQITLDVSAQNHRYLKTPSGTVVISESNAVSSDCPSNLGGSDIWIALLE